MCFSPEADVVSAVVIGVGGVDAARHVQQRAQWPLAALPLLLATHTFVEAFVWWGVRGEVSSQVQTVATAVYLGIAFVVLPVYVPVTVLLLERSARHRLIEIVALAAGLLCAAGLAAALVAGPVRASPEGHHIVYHVHLHATPVIIALYLVSTCGVLVVSGRPFLRWFGIVNVAAVALLAWVATDAVTSLWCAWAAVTSIAVAVYLRSTGPAGRRSNTARPPKPA
jgi:hypothetical protein